MRNAILTILKSAKISSIRRKRVYAGARERRRGVMRLSPAKLLILELLRENSRRSLTEIADITGLSRPTVKYHIAKLVEAGVIRRFTIDVDFTDTDTLPVTCVRVMLDIQLKRNACSTVYNSIANWHELVSVWSLSGAVDMRLLLEAPSLAAIEELRDRIARHPDVVSVTTFPILKTWCERISSSPRQP